MATTLHFSIYIHRDDCGIGELCRELHRGIPRGLSDATSEGVEGVIFLVNRTTSHADHNQSRTHSCRIRMKIRQQLLDYVKPSIVTYED